MKSEWYYKSYCVPKDCHKWNRFMGQEILRGNLADFGFALQCTIKIYYEEKTLIWENSILVILSRFVDYKYCFSVYSSMLNNQYMVQNLEVHLNNCNLT